MQAQAVHREMQFGLDYPAWTRFLPTSEYHIRQRLHPAILYPQLGSWICPHSLEYHLKR